ncbi:hypothetical protein EHN06_02905 [Marinobacter sp. NP-4(2019)]|uniref:hypothetical protein n=1 Tax=Marinobacter sp. NP-4(2019) TaxID=2488665 RepID=UPI000FC3F29F|nr:hypothetical protein [Marinobacter sp. NP-4(2019)]AZT82573.1 hypothetical protein EHN06_02905 [Marinobacter sp. NP-4(2019)]
MFTFEELTESIKDLAKNSDLPSFTHCQKLCALSRELGFDHYNHLTSTLAGLPTDRFKVMSQELVRQCCLRTKPDSEGPYNQLSVDKDWLETGISFQGDWIGFDSEGNDIRIPRSFNGQRRFDLLEKFFDSPFYVLKTEKHFMCWLHIWSGTALIPRDLVRANFPEFFDRSFLLSQV